MLLVFLFADPEREERETDLKERSAGSGCRRCRRRRRRCNDRTGSRRRRRWCWNVFETVERRSVRNTSRSGFSLTSEKHRSAAMPVTVRRLGVGPFGEPNRSESQRANKNFLNDGHLIAPRFSLFFFFLPSRTSWKSVSLTS